MLILHGYNHVVFWFPLSDWVSAESGCQQSTVSPSRKSWPLSRPARCLWHQQSEAELPKLCLEIIDESRIRNLLPRYSGILSIDRRIPYACHHPNPNMEYSTITTSASFFVNFSSFSLSLIRESPKSQSNWKSDWSNIFAGTQTFRWKDRHLKLPSDAPPGSDDRSINLTTWCWSTITEKALAVPWRVSPFFSTNMSSTRTLSLWGGTRITKYQESIRVNLLHIKQAGIYINICHWYRLFFCHKSGMRLLLIYLRFFIVMYRNAKHRQADFLGSFGLGSEAKSYDEWSERRKKWLHWIWRKNDFPRLLWGTRLSKASSIIWHNEGVSSKNASLQNQWFNHCDMWAFNCKITYS